MSDYIVPMGDILKLLETDWLNEEEKAILKDCVHAQIKMIPRVTKMLEEALFHE